MTENRFSTRRVENLRQGRFEKKRERGSRMTSETQKPPRRYEKMRDSGVEWIGMVPENATIVRLKHLTAYIESGTSVNAGQSPAQNSEFGILKTSCVSKFVFSPGENKSVNLDEYDRVHCPVCHNTIIVSRMNTPDLVGACGYVDRDYPNLFLPDRLWQVHFKTSVNVKYLWYYLQSCAVRQYYASLATGTSSSMQNISQQQFLNVPVVLFPDTFAFQIVSFLDNKCQQIDALIAEARASIEEYKTWKASIIYEAVTKGLDPHAEMKDSGVKWIGEIPAAWSTCALKRLTVKIGSGKTPLGGAETYTSHGVLFLRSQNIYDTGLRLDNASYISPEVNESMKNTQVEPGDVLLNITGGSIGRCCVYDLDGIVANVNQHVCIIRTKQEILRPQYLRYFWNSAAGPMVISQCQTGGNRPGLNFEQIGSVKIPLCNIASQDSIIKYLDSKTYDIDSLIQEKQSLISDLESYKKSLIYEVVTGKRKVI